MRRILAPLALAAVLTGCATSSATEPPAGPDTDTYARQIADETNRARVARGLDPLEWSDCAAHAGQERAADLAGKQLEHAPLTRVIADCASQGVASENLVDSKAAPADVVDAWLGSPGHANNILDPQVTGIGVGCVPNAGRLLCSQVFVG